MKSLRVAPFFALLLLLLLSVTPGRVLSAPSDAELPSDNGAYLSWWATDAERREDVGIPSKSVIPGQDKSCQVYSFPVYSFVDLLRWDGRIVVQLRASR